MIVLVISFALVKFYAFAILYVLIIIQIKLAVVVVEHLHSARLLPQCLENGTGHISV